MTMGTRTTVTLGVVVLILGAVGAIAVTPSVSSAAPTEASSDATTTTASVSDSGVPTDQAAPTASVPDSGVPTDPIVATASSSSTRASTGTAAAASVSARRAATNQVRFEIAFENASTNLSSVTVSVGANGVTESVRVSARDNGTRYLGAVSVTRLTKPGNALDLSNAEFHVEHNGTTLGSARVNLQLADLSGVESSFDAGSFVLGNVTLRGYESTATVRVDVGSATLNATYDATDSETLALPRDALSALDRGALFSPTAVSVNASAAPAAVDVTRSEGAVNVRAAAERATTLAYADDAFVLRNPLVDVLGTDRFALDLRTENPDGRFVSTVNATGDVIALPRDATGASVTATLAVDDWDGERVLADWSGEPVSTSVTVGVDGSRVEIGDGRSAASLLYETDGEVVRAALEPGENETYVTNASVPTEGSVLVVGDDVVYAGSFTSVNLSVAQADNGTTTPGENGTATATPTTGTDGAAGNASAVFEFGDVSYGSVDLGLLFGGALLVGGVIGVFLGVYRWFNRSPVRGYRPTDRDGAIATLVLGLLGGIVTGGLVLYFGMDATLGPLGILPGLFLAGLGGSGGCWTAGYGMVALGYWGDASKQERAAGTTTAVVPVVLELVTETNRPLTETAEITATSYDGSDRKRSKTDSGQATLQLAPGTWKLVVAVGDRQWEDTIEVGRSDPKVKARIDCSRPKVGVSLADGGDGEPIPDATVTVDPDGGDVREATTDREGNAGVSLPYSVTSASLTVDHPKYTARTRDVSLEDDLEKAFDVALERKTGELTVVAKVDGVATADLPVSIEPAEGDQFRANDRRRSIRTDEAGNATAALLVGEYVVSLALPDAHSAQFRTDTSTVRIGAGTHERVSVQATFEWSLPSETRERIRSVRADVQSLSDRAGRDVAFPRYYGTVIESILDLVEDLPANGHRFVRSQQRPDPVASALLDAAEEGVSRVNTAMTTKRNVDMFAACADMPDATVEWAGDAASYDAFFERLDGRSDGDLSRRLEETKTRIDDERGQLTEVEPATEMWETARDLFQDARRAGDELDRAAKEVLVAALLDAVAETFDRDPLRERMKQTVF